MKSKATDLLKLKQTAEDLSKRKEQATGRMQELLSRLKTEFGCNSLDEARDLLTRYHQQRKEKWVKFERLMAKFRQQYGDLL